MDGVLESYQSRLSSRFGFHIHFKPNGPLHKDWIFGQWYDQDSLSRLIGYREGGRWKPLPFAALNNVSHVTDIAQYGDTLYMLGLFSWIVLDGQQDTLPYTSLLKMHGDSIWGDGINIHMARDISVSGDSILVWGDGFFGTQDTVWGVHLLSTNAGANWNGPFKVPHPTDTARPNFGAYPKLEIKNGRIFTLNDHSYGRYGGITHWDGQQWHSYGEGVRGTYSAALDFEFYQNELFLAGSFTKRESPLNPGEFIARWDGQQWHEVGGGLNTVASDLFVYNDKLYCQIYGALFGDAHIPAFAAWDGNKWCGTPISYSGLRGSWLAHGTLNFGIIKDTLYMVCPNLPTSADGQPLAYLNYFDGDYLNGPNAICSTPGLGEVEIAAIDFKLFPNPARQEVHISSGEEAIRYLTLYDMAGRCVLEESFSTGTSEVSLDISGLVPGIYVLEVNGSVQRKFVKE